MKKKKPIRIEGYWWNEDNPGYIFPDARNKVWKGWADFLDGLIVLQNSEEMEEPVHSKGWSTCRLCCVKVGSVTYSFEDANYEWQWPEGLEHYVREHKVKPSKDFRAFIKKMRYQIRYE